MAEFEQQQEQLEYQPETIPDFSITLATFIRAAEKSKLGFKVTTLDFQITNNPSAIKHLAFIQALVSENSEASILLLKMYFHTIVISKDRKFVKKCFDAVPSKLHEKVFPSH